MVPFVYPSAIGLARSDGELELEGLRVEPADDVEPGIGEDAKHCDVLWEDDRDEALYAMAPSNLRELLEQTCADAAALERVGDRERHLGLGRIAEAIVASDGDDARTLAIGERADESAALLPIRIEDVLDELGGERR